jgi:hypothetical protein
MLSLVIEVQGVRDSCGTGRSLALHHVTVCPSTFSKYVTLENLHL